MNWKKITDKRGDGGMTDLYDGTKISKSSDLIKTIGKIDGFRAWLGVCIVGLKPDTFLECDVYEELVDIQDNLVIIMGELCRGGKKPKKKLTDLELAYLDKRLEFYGGYLNDINYKLSDWVVYGKGSKISANIDYATTLCREIETLIIDLKESKKDINIYFNRLSKVLFLMARCVEK